MTMIGPSPAIPEVYLAIVHSGVSLAPIAGEPAAQGNLGSVSASGHEDDCADRTFEIVKRY